MLCFINIRLQTHQFEFAEQFRVDIQAKPEVLECHHLTGEFDYLLKVVIKNRQDLERFVVQELTPLQGVSRIYTSLVLSEIKATTAVPI
jgi:DNA-binding Lrp family transcriptional regulator